MSGRLLKRLFGGGAPEKPEATSTPAAPLDLAAAKALYAEGRWRAALELLEAAHAGEGADAAALVLWMQCRADLSQRQGLEQAFDRLLSFPDATAEDVGTAYTCGPWDEKEAWGRKLLAWAGARRLSADERERALRGLPMSLWDADQLFDAIAKSSEGAQYDELLTHAKARFSTDARLAQVKVRPLSANEQRRLAHLAQQEAAKRAYEARQAARAEAAGKSRREPRLEAAILANRDDVTAHEVYGDWLQQQGDPRGELVVVQCQRAREPDDAALEAAEAALVTKLSAALLGELTEAGGVRARFHLGFLDALRLARTHDDDFEDDLLEALFGLDERRFLRALTLGALELDDNVDYSQALATLAARAGELPSLNELFVGDFTSEECELSWSELGDASPLYTAFPRLHSLKLRAGTMDLGELALPNLVAFALETGGLTRENLRAVREAKWPRLRSLSLWFGQEDYGGECTVDDVAPLLERGDLALTHLGLANAEFTDDLVPLLARSPLLPKLESLDLSLGCLTARGAQALVDQRARFAHLKRLDLSRNCLEDDAVDLVRGLCAEVAVDDQETDRAGDDFRYAAVGE